MVGERQSLNTLLIGIDGASFRVLDTLFDDGSLPHLKSIFGEGTSSRLRSQIPPWTASAWPSLYTGTNPGKHGVFGFLSFEGYDWSVVNATHVSQRPIWHLLDKHDCSSVVVNVPVTHPPQSFDGALIPGYAAPKNPECHPAGLLEDVRDAIGEYHVYGDSEGKSKPDRPALLTEYCELIEMRGRAFRYLCNRFSPDFGFVQFQQTDTVCHDCPGDYDAYRKVYSAVDEEIGKILETVSPRNVFVVSDHGLGPFDQRVAVNEFLRDAGHITTTSQGSGMPTWARIRDNDLRNTNKNAGVWAMERTVSALASVGITSQNIGSILDKLGLAEKALHVMPDDVVRSGSEQVDFANSRAFVRSRVECGVRINLVGREPDGVVAPDDYNRIRKNLIKELSGLEDPDGTPVFEEVAPREEYFHGSEAKHAVDIVTVPRSFNNYVTTWLTGELFKATDGPSWDHKRHGVIAAHGDSITDDDLGGAHLFDVAPTVLAAMDVPVDKCMDGHILPIVNDVGKQSYPDFEKARKTTDSDAVESRLSDLGYLE